ncbi:dolichyl-phosphate beta-glucosyltransferase [Nonlabens agnitus]|uniref:dolichyl-phosphate beta-glucosyltransferase n=1 Tax=Nonlabens agnitus TaxID=870484 RepID=A0A2S9WRX8_9FLAO|nr:dolichyl-phosphate beta-glucosyltransferase [Nonlabens agnitus]PRP66231.1 glycosyl transferase family 2 [Nonlabens agnitus]
MKTGIIIPCYNEANRIDQQAFVDFAISHQDYHLCFVNDGSIDNTNDILEKMQWKSPYNISIVDIKKNAGKAAAVRSGSQYMYGIPEITSIGFIDADLSTDFRDFKDLVKTLHRDEKLMVFGSRNMGTGAGIKRDLMRNLLSKFIKQFIGMILGLPIRDTQCGAKVFKREIVPFVYGKSFLSRWLFDVEIFLRLKKYLGKEKVMKQIVEQPLMRWVHVDDSKLGMKDALKIPFNLTQIWLNYAVTNTGNPVVVDHDFTIAAPTLSTQRTAA